MFPPHVLRNLGIDPSNATPEARETARQINDAWRWAFRNVPTGWRRNVLREGRVPSRQSASQQTAPAPTPQLPSIQELAGGVNRPAGMTPHQEASTRVAGLLGMGGGLSGAASLPALTPEDFTGQPAAVNPNIAVSPAQAAAPLMQGMSQRDFQQAQQRLLGMPMPQPAAQAQAAPPMTWREQMIATLDPNETTVRSTPTMVESVSYRDPALQNNPMAEMTRGFGYINPTPDMWMARYGGTPMEGNYEAFMQLLQGGYGSGTNRTSALGNLDLARQTLQGLPGVPGSLEQSWLSTLMRDERERDRIQREDRRDELMHGPERNRQAIIAQTVQSIMQSGIEQGQSPVAAMQQALQQLPTIQQLASRMVPDTAASTTMPTTFTQPRAAIGATRPAGQAAGPQLPPIPSSQPGAVQRDVPGLTDWLPVPESMRQGNVTVNNPLAGITYRGEGGRHLVDRLSSLASPEQRYETGENWLRTVLPELAATPDGQAFVERNWPTIRRLLARHMGENTLSHYVWSGPSGFWHNASNNPNAAGIGRSLGLIPYLWSGTVGNLTGATPLTTRAREIVRDLDRRLLDPDRQRAIYQSLSRTSMGQPGVFNEPAMSYYQFPQDWQR